MRAIAFLRSLLSYFLIFLTCLIFVPFLALLVLLPEDYRFQNRLYFFLIYLFYRCMLFSTFLPIDVTGWDNIPNEPVIMVANHQSTLDIFVMGYINRFYPHTWLVLEYYTRTPILGFFIRRMTIPVDRAQSVKAGRSLVKLLRLFEQFKINVIIFPEGGRHSNKVNEFFPGFAVLAQKTNKPVIPVYMPNNAAIYPVSTFIINWYPIKAIIGKPMYIEPNETVEDFTKRVHNWFVGESQKVPLK